MALNLKSLLFVSLFIALVAAPIAEATVLFPIRLLQINGAVFCTPTGNNIGVNGTLSPPFPNATVRLQCGPGNVVANAITNPLGVFSTIVLFPLNLNLSSLLNICTLVVVTPLSNCNSTLPPVGLVSPIQLNGSIIIGPVNITIIIPTRFQILR
ncbi:hypothetical protein Ddye_020898 [Dipteronia dyeriana]|uniref:Phylloplanin-like n=1 Tax=Dipteronia dyeriana TaxID=168575 RepID=A0AAD9U117_9ROSI|nr:hypothetical protein Ddye_020898 [Dipteronia dyeriana]